MKSMDFENQLYVFIFFFMPILVFACCFFVHAVKLTFQSLRSRDWPTTQAIIKQCELEEHEDEGKTFYIITLVYQYQVDNQSYEHSRIGRYGNNLVYHKSFLCSKDDIKAHTHYKVGDEITIHYDPQKPSEACIANGLHQYTLGRLIFGFIVVAFSIVLGLVIGGQLFYTLS
jgi:hypothetical protein